MTITFGYCEMAMPSYLFDVSVIWLLSAGILTFLGLGEALALSIKVLLLALSTLVVVALLEKVSFFTHYLEMYSAGM